MDMSSESHDRIFAAAEALYEQNGRTTFPTVDAVRKKAKVNMNDASAGMKEWRRAQIVQAAPVAVQVPESVQQAGSHVITVLWQQAQELANKSLRAAQAGWEAEVAELDTMRQELADAYEVQADELKQAQARIAKLEEDLRIANEQALKSRNAHTATERRAELAEQKAADVERRATDLRAELDHAHKEVDQQRIERDKARREAIESREAAATLQGRVEALEAMLTHQEVKRT